MRDGSGPVPFRRAARLSGLSSSTLPNPTSRTRVASATAASISSVAGAPARAWCPRWATASCCRAVARSCCSGPDREASRLGSSPRRSRNRFALTAAAASLERERCRLLGVTRPADRAPQPCTPACRVPLRPAHVPCAPHHISGAHAAVGGTPHSAQRHRSDAEYIGKMGIIKRVRTHLFL